MEGIPMLKIDFPLVKTISGSELLEWYKQTISPTLESLKELGNGGEYCYSMEILFPGCIGKQRIKLETHNLFDRRHNLKLLKSAFNSLKINKDDAIRRLQHGNFINMYDFALWYKAFYEANYKGIGNNLTKFQVSSQQLKYRHLNTTTGGFTRISGGYPLKAITKSDDSADEENYTPVTKSALQRKRKIPLITDRANKPRLSTISHLDTDQHKSSRHKEAVGKQKPQALLRQITELKKIVGDLSGRILEFQKRQQDAEERITNLRQLNEDLNKDSSSDAENYPNTSDHVQESDSPEVTNEENEEAAKANEELCKKNSELDLELNETINVVKDQRAVIDELKLVNERDCEQIAQLESVVSEQKQANKELTNANQKQASHIEKLQESVNTQMRQMECLEQIMNEQLRSLEDLTQRKTELEKTLENIETTKRDTQATIKRLSKNNKSMDAHIKYLEQDYSEVLRQNNQLTKCNQELARHFSDLSKENRDLHQRNHRLTKNYEAILCYSCSSSKLYFKQLLKIEKACKMESNGSLRKSINTILQNTKYHPPYASNPKPYV